MHARVNDITMACDIHIIGISKIHLFLCRNEERKIVINETRGTVTERRAYNIQTYTAI